MTKRLLHSLVLWLSLAVLACLAGGRVLSTHAAEPTVPPPSPMLVRQGHRLFVPEGSPLRARLAVAATDAQGAAHELVLPAMVEADPARTANILPPLTGRLVDLRVRLGDVVKRGQLLASLSAPDLAQAVSDAQKARDALDLAQRALTRARGVNEAGSNATKDVEAAESAVAQQAAELRRSESRLRSLGASASASTRANATGTLPITSPTSGAVTALNVAPGAVLNDATAALMTVTDLDQVWVTVNVPEHLVGTVRAGQEAVVTLAAYPGRTWVGRIGFVGAMLDADTRRAKARIAFANADGLLKPNMYASARIALPESAEPQVPSSALLMNNDAVSVFVEVAPWTFERHPVETGREDGEQVRVRSGLAAGERVVVRGGVLLND